MKVKKISFPIPLKDVEDIYNDNIDVFVSLEKWSQLYSNLRHLSKYSIFVESRK